MRYVKLETSDQDERWINLEQVCRITFGTESPEVPIVAIIFADGNVDDCFKIRGTDETNRRAITKLADALESLSTEDRLAVGENSPLPH